MNKEIESALACVEGSYGCNRKWPGHNCKCAKILAAALRGAMKELEPFIGSASYACGHLVKARKDGHSIGCPVCAELLNAYKRAEAANAEKEG